MRSVEFKRIDDLLCSLDQFVIEEERKFFIVRSTKFNGEIDPYVYKNKLYEKLRQFRIELLIDVSVQIANEKLRKDFIFNLATLLLLVKKRFCYKLKKYLLKESYCEFHALRMIKQYFDQLDNIHSFPNSHSKLIYCFSRFHLITIDEALYCTEIFSLRNGLTEPELKIAKSVVHEISLQNPLEFEKLLIYLPMKDLAYFFALMQEVFLSKQISKSELSRFIAAFFVNPKTEAPSANQIRKHFYEVDEKTLNNLADIILKMYNLVNKKKKDLGM